MNKLIPQEVPWELDTISYIRVKAEEDGELIIKFNAFFANKKNIYDVYSKEEIEKKQIDNEKGFGDVYTLDDYKEYQYQIINLKFSSFFLFSMKHSIEDYDILYSGKYKVDQPLLNDFSKDPLQYNKEKYKICQEIGINPDSGFYMVENSEILSEFERKFGMKHFIIAGKESYVEVVGKDWIYEPISAVFK